MEFVDRLRCPITGNGLELIKKEDFPDYDIPLEYEAFGKLSSGLVDGSKQYFFPVFDDIMVLHEHYALYIGNKEDVRGELSFD